MSNGNVGEKAKLKKIHVCIMNSNMDRGSSANQTGNKVMTSLQLLWHHLLFVRNNHVAVVK